MSLIPFAPFKRREPVVVIIVATPPDAGVVAPLVCAVEPLVHAPEAVQSARGSDDLPGQFV